MKQIAVLTSGMSRGSNFMAMADTFRSSGEDVGIAFVVATVQDAPVVSRCREMGVPVHVLPPTQPVFETALKSLLQQYPVDAIVLAGFLKLLSSDFIEQSGCPILNIHPALLPRYGGKGMYGKNVHEAVWAAKEPFSGATVHLVNAHYDEGKILRQERISVADCPSPEAVAARVLTVEHRLYGAVILDFLAGRIS